MNAHPYWRPVRAPRRQPGELLRVLMSALGVFVMIVALAGVVNGTRHAEQRMATAADLEARAYCERDGGRAFKDLATGAVICAGADGQKPPKGMR